MSSAAKTLVDADPAGPTASATLPEPPLTVIERRSGWAALDLRELWRYRELLLFLAWRDIKVRYKQTVLGAVWALIQPLATMAVFVLFLRPGGDQVANYPLFAFVGLWAWTFFGNSLSSASQSVVANQNLVTKVYFPRMLIPMAAAGAGLIDFLVGAGVFLVLLLCSPGETLGWTVLLMPLLVLFLGLAAVGVGALLAALTVAYRDFKHVIPFMVQFWLFATPSIYRPPSTDLWTRGLLSLNPAYGLILNFRQAALGQALDPLSLAISATVGILLVGLGFAYFRRVERGFADII